MISIKKVFLNVLFMSAISAAPVLMADTDHAGSHKKDTHGAKDSSTSHENHSNAMSGMFLKKVQVDGYDVSFHVMKAKPGKEMGGSHDFMIKVEKNGKALTEMEMNTKVVYPNGTSESKRTMKMGDWLMAGYDLNNEGKHQMMILFKTPDGKKHKGGVYYP